MIPGERLTPVLAAVLMSLAIAGSGPQGAQARQTSPSFLFRDVELSGALEYIARSGRLELVYSTDLVTGQRVFCDGRNLADEDLLRCVLTGTGLDYIRSSTGTYIIIRSLELLPALGALSGRIVDRATGAPLPYANILLVSAGIGSTSDAAGLFSFSGVPVGPQQVMASYVGFDAVLDTVFVSDDAGRYPKLIALNQAAMALDVIVVDGSSARRDPARSLETQGPERRVDVQLVSSVMSRALRAPGVSALHPLADVYIQGSDSGEHGTRLDGAPVYSPVSLGRYLSAFSPLALSRATVHRAAFPVELGSYLSGLVDVTQESGGDRGSLLEASVDPASANFRISTAPSGRGSGMLAVRTSLWPTVREPGLSSLLGSLNQIDPLLGTRWLKEAVSLSTVGEVIRDPQISFSDVHLGGTMGLGPVGRLEASAYRGDNRIGTELSGVNTAGGSSAPHAFVTDDAYRWSNTVGQVRYSTLLRARTHLVVQAYGSAHRARYRYRTGDVVLDSETNADGAILRLRREGTAPAAESENRMDDRRRVGTPAQRIRPRESVPLECRDQRSRNACGWIPERACGPGSGGLDLRWGSGNVGSPAEQGVLGAPRVMAAAQFQAGASSHLRAPGGRPASAVRPSAGIGFHRAHRSRPVRLFLVAGGCDDCAFPRVARSRRDTDPALGDPHPERGRFPEGTAPSSGIRPRSPSGAD
jgi:carboxypeptidase-like protein